MRARTIVGFAKQKLVLLTAVILAAVVGGATTAIVLAAVPDATGHIYGCHSSGNDFRLIDTENSQACTGGETQVSWNRHGVLAFGLVYTNTGLMTGTDSRNINDVYESDGQYAGAALCFEIEGAPRSATIVGYEGDGTEGLGVIVRQSTSTQGINDMIDGICGNNTDVDLVVKGAHNNAAYYLTVFE